MKENITNLDNEMEIEKKNRNSADNEKISHLEKQVSDLQNKLQDKIKSQNEMVEKFKRDFQEMQAKDQKIREEESHANQAKIEYQ